jgi:uncharacterized phage-associated protein
MDKNQAFNYMITLFKEWHIKETSDNSAYKTAFSKLSLLKLLFLTAATPNDESSDLLDVFDNFYALPYGPVESDIYKDINADTISNFTITERAIIEKVAQESGNKELTAAEQLRIKNAVDTLRSKNSKLVTLNAFELVNITHRWDSWQSAYSFAQFMEQQSAKITSESIRNDKNKFYEIN